MTAFETALIYGSFGIASLFMSGYWGVIFKQVIPTMLFAVIGLFLVGMGYKASPFGEEK